MAQMEFPSLKDQLRSLVNREFTGYIPVPSLAEASKFNVLSFCSPESVDESTKPSQQSLLTAGLTSIKKAFYTWLSSLDTGDDLAKLISLGCLFDYCPDNSVKVKMKEEPIYMQGQGSGSQLSGGMQAGKVAAGSASFENRKVLNLGKIMTISLPYREISYWLKRVTFKNSPELFIEAKKGHLYVIYEVLTAEYLKNEAEENSNIDGTVATGTGSWKRNKSYRLSRPKSMGRYNFAYKCGRVRLKKHKKSLGLVGLKEFYKGFLTEQSK